MKYVTMTLALLVCSGATLTGEAKAQFTSTFVIKSRATGLVLDDPAFSRGPAFIQQWDPNGGQNQDWVMTQGGTDNGGDYYKIVNLFSRAALDVPAFSKTAGQNIQQWPYIGGSNQHWYVQQVLDDWTDFYPNRFWIINRNSSLFLQVPDSSQGTKLQQGNYTGGFNQQWVLLGF